MAKKIILFLNRWAIAIICLLVFMATLFFQLIYPDTNLFFKSSDPYWLINMGEWILKNKTIPYTNILGEPFLELKNINWVCYQWLFSVILAIFNKLAGIRGLMLIFAGLNALVIALLGYSLHLRKLRHFPEIGLSLFPVTIFLLINTDFRPAIFSILFCLILSIIFINYKDCHSKKLWFIIPAIFLIWANMHMGFIFGIIWLFFEITVWCFKTKSYKPILLWLIAFAATLLNPRGFFLYDYLNKLGNSSFMNQNIAELRHFDFSFDYSLSILVVLGILSFIFTLKSKEIRLAEKIMFLVSFFMTMFSIRHISFLLIFLPLFYSSAIKSVLDKTGADFSYIFREKYKSFYYLVIILIFGIVLCLNKTYPVPMMPRFINKNFIEYLNKNPVPEPILSAGDTGDELLFYTKTRSYIDTRYDMYGDDYLEKTSELYYGSNPETNVAEWDKINYVLYDKSIGKDSFKPVEKNFTSNGWKVLYKDTDLLFLGKH